MKTAFRSLFEIYFFNFQMIYEGKLFILHHEIFNDLPNVPDILGINKYAKLFPSVSPIVVMVLDDRVKELKMVAIQLDHIRSIPN